MRLLEDCEGRDLWTWDERLGEKKRGGDQVKGGGTTRCAAPVETRTARAARGLL